MTNKFLHIYKEAGEYPVNPLYCDADKWTAAKVSAPLTPWNMEKQFPGYEICPTCLKNWKAERGEEEQKQARKCGGCKPEYNCPPCRYRPVKK